MQILTLIFYVVLAYLTLSVGWLVLLTIYSWLFKARKWDGAEPLMLGVVVPAHNEAGSIAQTIESIRKCDYPQEKLRIIVLADNCEDETAAIATRAGALALERVNPDERGKGQALDWFLKTQKNHYVDLDGLSFVDADVICDPLLFRELSNSLSHPDVRVVQGFNGVANPLVNWRTALVTAAFNVFNHLRMAGTNQLFGTAMLKGLGMAFETEILEKYGWPAHSRVEDVEFSMLLLKEDIAIHYNPEAVITSEMASTRQQADSQRQRWEGGRFKLAASLLPGLLLNVIKGKTRYLHAAMDLLVLPLSLLVVFLFIWTVLASIWVPAAFPWLLVLLWGIIFYVASGQLQRRVGLKMWLYLGAAPLFVFWKLLVYAKMLFQKKQAGWTRTLRDSEMDDK